MGALSAVSIALVSDWPLTRTMLEVCKQLFRFRQQHALGRGALGTHVRSLACALGACSAEVTFLMQHPLWLPTPLAPPIEAAKHQTRPSSSSSLRHCSSGRSSSLSASVSRLLPVAAALAHTLLPLSYSGTFIPFLPAALHPDPATLVNCSPTPFIIGVERAGIGALQPLAPHVLVFDVDDGSLSGPDAMAELRAFASAPLVAQLSASLHRFTSGGADSAAASSRGERGLQGVLLSFMRELLATHTQNALRSSADSIDVQRAAECAAAWDLATDVLQFTSDMGAQREAIARRVLMCRADALVRITAAEPQTPTCAFLSAPRSRTVREFLLTPESATGADNGGSSGGGVGGGVAAAIAAAAAATIVSGSPPPRGASRTRLGWRLASTRSNRSRSTRRRSTPCSRSSSTASRRSARCSSATASSRRAPPTFSSASRSA